MSKTKTNRQSAATNHPFQAPLEHVPKDNPKDNLAPTSITHAQPTHTPNGPAVRSGHSTIRST
ncbi:unknown [Tropheryma whipplei str. Twist]|uniref:Uncharacterized protein n=1 Tax=Tropheryma whipplei (strain Twist) TaxID=203267 RepID=Q83FT4_TROWT|nr:unknown [Tropheryma whipplei str. Twist]